MELKETKRECENKYECKYKYYVELVYKKGYYETTLDNPEVEGVYTVENVADIYAHNDDTDTYVSFIGVRTEERYELLKERLQKGLIVGLKHCYFSCGWNSEYYIDDHYKVVGIRKEKIERTIEEEIH